MPTHGQLIVNKLPDLNGAVGHIAIAHFKAIAAGAARTIKLRGNLINLRKHRCQLWASQPWIEPRRCRWRFFCIRIHGKGADQDAEGNRRQQRRPVHSRPGHRFSSRVLSETNGSTTVWAKSIPFVYSPVTFCTFHRPLPQFQRIFLSALKIIQYFYKSNLHIPKADLYLCVCFGSALKHQAP